MVRKFIIDDVGAFAEIEQKSGIFQIISYFEGDYCIYVCAIFLYLEMFFWLNNRG